jgi:hypothetical protein
VKAGDGSAKCGLHDFLSMCLASSHKQQCNAYTYD